MKIKRKNKLACKLTKLIFIDQDRNATMLFLKELTTIKSPIELNKIVPTDFDYLKHKVEQHLSWERELIEIFNSLQLDYAETKVVSVEEYEKDTQAFPLDGGMITAFLETPKEPQLLALHYKDTEELISKLAKEGKPSQRLKVTYMTLDTPMEGEDYEAV